MEKRSFLIEIRAGIGSRWEGESSFHTRLHTHTHTHTHTHMHMRVHTHGRTRVPLMDMGKMGTTWGNSTCAVTSLKMAIQRRGQERGE